MPRMFSSKFLIFSIIVIVVATVGVIYFDRSDPSKFDPLHFGNNDTTKPVPYKGIEMDTTHEQ